MAVSFESAKSVRVQIEFAENRIHELNDLMVRCGVSTKKELFNNAISILEWAVEETEARRAVASVDRKNTRYEILRMPVLDAAAKHASEREASEHDAEKPDQGSLFRPATSTGR
jgi:hypothetical protein